MGVAAAEALSAEASRLRSWLAAGFHATMAYMADTAEVRCDPRHERMLPGARSIVVLVTPYGGGEAPRLHPGRLARYARSRDYHNVLQRRLRKLAGWLRVRGHPTRTAVDTMPVFERAWAQRAGVGFVGKNCCLIVPGLGSHVFLSALVTSAVLPPDSPMAQRCGSCRACLDACPTGAFAGPGRLDARRCVSYLTIEHRGPIPREQRAGVEDWVFGCDACQDVCPYNRTPRALHADAAFAQERFDVSAAAFLTMDEDRFAEVARGSPLRRAGRAGLTRNAAVVLGNRGDKNHLPVLSRAAANDPDTAVREAAAWAIERIQLRARSRH